MECKKCKNEIDQTKSTGFYIKKLESWFCIDCITEAFSKHESKACDCEKCNSIKTLVLEKGKVKVWNTHISSFVDPMEKVIQDLRIYSDKEEIIALYEYRLQIENTYGKSIRTLAVNNTIIKKIDKLLDQEPVECTKCKTVTQLKYSTFMYVFYDSDNPVSCYYCFDCYEHYIKNKKKDPQELF